MRARRAPPTAGLAHVNSALKDALRAQTGTGAAGAPTAVTMTAGTTAVAAAAAAATVTGAAAAAAGGGCSGPASASSWKACRVRGVCAPCPAPRALGADCVVADRRGLLVSVRVCRGRGLA